MTSSQSHLSRNLWIIGSVGEGVTFLDALLFFVLIGLIVIIMIVGCCCLYRRSLMHNLRQQQTKIASSRAENIVNTYIASFNRDENDTRVPAARRTNADALEV
mmetsp:Transcript_21291/g.32159  ORF Transcript_21291/g.32159 Transcript_21291/m.32159 type:complete len:103 (-) Transcript_21291:101-409(-)